VLKDNIACLQSVLTDLLSQQKLSKARVRKHTHLLAPIRRLPTELLRAIFLFTVPPRHELLPATYNGFGTRVSPWILTRVCSRWRNIALSFPALWQTIVLPQTYFEDDSTDDSDADGTTQIYEYPYPLPMLQTQLVRSGKAPLHIIIQEDSQTIGEILPALVRSSEILVDLVTSCSRWETLEFPNEWWQFFSLFSGKVPLLRKLQIIFTDGPPFTGPEFNAPSLRDVSLRPYGVTPPLPWAQITRLELEGSWDEILTVLPPMANLLECYLYVEDSSPPSADKCAIVPALRKLYLRGTAHTTIPDNLCLPCLEDLFFTRGPLPASLPLQHSGCQLKRLRFPGLASIEALLKLFRQFPTITNLATNMKLGSDDSDSMKNLQDLFSGLLADATLLPDLQRVAIHVAGIGGPLTCIAELANLIEARRISVSLGGRRGILNKSHFAAFEKEVGIEVEADEDAVSALHSAQTTVSILVVA
ncbi:hypothetical protein B0H16DRAFT_1780568, partial [Mycena metata]